ncbi:MAG: RNA polymerase sigma-70 factor [Prolixibacteraceae bacterium]|jgi:RNA polymerase sigma-70 factor (ECF subfamily)|nr:RNA polymerase sigma-70 factor [Prolixibacteraceae bacterium]
MDIEQTERLKLITEQLKTGSKEAFHLLFDAYAPKIHAFALSYLKNESDADELLQELFLKLWEMRASLDSSKNIKSFLFKVCINLIYDMIRRKNIEQAYLNFSIKNIQTNNDSTWHEVIYNDMLVNLNLLVATMPYQRQRIFKLSKEDGLSNEEIALELGLSKRTVENQLYRAVSFLKEKLGRGSLPGLLFFFLNCT